ncbi:MAG: RidA family protein [Acidimicrobiia bacterium]|nr:RidA family protein [Acidimicrobiia bacterium]
MAADRKSYAVDGVPHGSPIPAAARVGPLIWSSPIPPRDPVTGDTPPDFRAQVERVFANMALVLEAAGVTFAHVGKIEFWMLDNDDRPALNAVWERHFPDETSRPARHVHLSAALPPGVRLTATFQAWAGDL